MKYKITNIKIPLESIPDLFKEFKFVKGQSYYTYETRIKQDNIAFMFECNVWLMDHKVSVYSLYCIAHTAEGEVPVVLPDGIDLDNYLQKEYERVL